MLNPFYFKTIHEYYQLRAKLADDTVLSRLETAKLKRMMNKNSEFKSLNKEEKKIAYQEYLSQYALKRQSTIDKINNFQEPKYFSFCKNTNYHPNFSFKTLEAAIEETVTEELESLDDEGSTLFLDYQIIIPILKPCLKMYLASALYFDLYALPLKANQLAEGLIIKTQDWEEKFYSTRAQVLYEKLQSTALLPFFKSTLENNTIKYSSKDIFDSITNELLYRIFYSSQYTSYPFHKNYFYNPLNPKKTKSKNRKPIEQYELDEHLELLKMLSVPLLGLNEFRSLYLQQILELLLNTDYIFYLSYLTPIIKFKNSAKDTSINSYFSDNIMPRILRIAQIPMPSFRVPFVACLFGAICRDMDRNRKNKSYEPDVSSDELDSIDIAIDEVFSLMKRSLFKFRELLLSNNITVNKSLLESFMLSLKEEPSLKEEYSLDMFEEYKPKTSEQTNSPTYIIPKKWHYITKKEYAYHLKLDDLTEFPCDIFSKNASPTLWPHRLVNKTKNNFCNYYKLINLAYLYDKTHYDIQTSTGEKYYYFNLLQDDRFKKENIQEFISSYCRKHNK